MSTALLCEGSFFSVLCTGDISQQVPQYKRRSKFVAIRGKHKALSVIPLVVLLQLTCWLWLNCLLFSMPISKTAVILQGYPSMKNLCTGTHLKGFVTFTLTEPRKRRNQNTFFFTAFSLFANRSFWEWFTVIPGFKEHSGMSTTHRFWFIPMVFHI